MSAISTGHAPPASEAWSLIRRLFAAEKPRFLAIAAEFDLSPPQLFALDALDPDTPLPMSELASALRCDNSNVTGIVDRLEDRGLVVRRAAAHDRRVKHLVVTPAGAEIRARVRARLYAAPQALLALGPEDQRALRDLLRRAVDAAS